MKKARRIKRWAFSWFVWRSSFVEFRRDIDFFYDIFDFRNDVVCFGIGRFRIFFRIDGIAEGCQAVRAGVFVEFHDVGEEDGIESKSCCSAGSVLPDSSSGCRPSIHCGKYGQPSGCGREYVASLTDDSTRTSPLLR
ncbi:hypothetical protein [Megasphaera sp.]|uniref:hypothetical protein n=1 Tax=Megasphaera sp. TaxID=2023260 RepID=UPI003F73BC17